MIRQARYVKFVRYSQIEDHFRLGWVILFPKRAIHHDHYGTELAWICDCAVPKRVSNRVPETEALVSKSNAA